MHQHLTNAQFTAFSWIFFSFFCLKLFCCTVSDSVGDSAVCVNTVRGLAPGLCLFRELGGRLPSNRGNGLMRMSSHSRLFTSPKAVSSAGKTGLDPCHGVAVMLMSGRSHVFVACCSSKLLIQGRGEETKSGVG